MRASIKSIVEIFARTFEPAGPVYEFGSLQVEGQEGFADLRPYFPGKRYVGCDMREGPGVDKILDINDPTGGDTLEINRPKTILCMDTMEHVEFPRHAVMATETFLQPEGILLMSSVMNFPIHGYPDDYWRFTPSGFKSLLSVFEHSFVGSAGQKKFPHTVIGVGFKSKTIPKEHYKFMAAFMDWQVKYS